MGEMVTEELVTMSRTEVDRLKVIAQVASKQIKQGMAAVQLGLTVRQVKRLLRRYRCEGAPGLVSRHRGKRPNNAIAGEVRHAVLALIRRDYADFGPTLACEMLTERHGYRLSVETLRQWMKVEGLWKTQERKRARIHQRRPRRPCLGELVQIDGSPHDWFEGRAPRCTLIVFIDDATGRLMGLRFAPAETTQAYMETLDDYLRVHGRPVALYSDKHSIFRINRPDQEGELTQFTRALMSLDIAPIHANSPQAKGRVERANQTLQDRLIKELRLQGLSDINAANAFLPTFLATHNARFARAPVSPVDAHRPLLHAPAELALILCLQYRRRLSKNLTCQFRNAEYQVQEYGRGYRLRGATVTVCAAFDGTVTLLHDGRLLPTRLFAKGMPPIPLDDEKSLSRTLEQAQKAQAARPAHKPAPDHPWKRPFKSALRSAP